MSNILVLSLSMFTSFILPIFISVEEYGYWQIFNLYFGYIGFFVLGFNDGVHLNYATCDYNQCFAAKFKGFKTFLSILSIAESLILLIILFNQNGLNSKTFYIAVLLIINIYPSTLIGMFTYMNQSTMRFKEYSVANIFDKLIFLLLMTVLLLCNQKDSLYYILAFTISRYTVIIYHYFTSREVFTQKGTSLHLLKDEIIKNYKDGFPLMIAIILGGPSIIVGSRFFVETQFGISSFGAYSFSLNTLVVASQFISAIATVFYPILKRCKSSKDINEMYVAFDKMATVSGLLILLSYYPLAIIIKEIYVKYIVVLDYLYILYPLFLFQCKVNVLVTNMYKVYHKIYKLIIVNILGIFLHIVSVLIAYRIDNSLTAIVLATLISYALWYYILQLHTYSKNKWLFRFDIFNDLVVTCIFIIINFFVIRNIDGIDNAIYIGLFFYMIVCLLIFLLFKRNILNTIQNFMKLMK